MSSDDELRDGGEPRDAMLTETEKIADDIRWQFRTRDEWVLTTEEIVDSVDADPEQVKKVLVELENRQDIHRVERDAETAWAPVV